MRAESVWKKTGLSEVESTKERKESFVLHGALFQDLLLPRYKLLGYLSHFPSFLLPSALFCSLFLHLSPSLFLLFQLK